MVVGSVGSGKSCLCQAVIGQVHKSEGEVEVVGSVAYVAQTAWIRNASVKDNILFGLPYDAKRFQYVTTSVILS